MKKLRVLLADDHPEMLNAICGVLEDKLSEVVETVVPMLQPDGSWRVSGYYVRMSN